MTEQTLAERYPEAVERAKAVAPAMAEMFHHFSDFTEAGRGRFAIRIWRDRARSEK